MPSAQETLAGFVGQGNMRVTVTPDVALSKERAVELRDRMRDFHDRSLPPPPNAGASPADFQAAMAEREERDAARTRQERGQDIPRFSSRNPTLSRALKGIYNTHDTLVGLPTPAGLGVIILAIVLLFLVLIPATGKGETRLLLLWDVLLGRKAMDSGSPAPAGQTATPAPGPFDPIPQSPAPTIPTNTQSFTAPLTNSGSGIDFSALGLGNTL